MHKIIAVQGDPIENLNYETDTSILLAEEFANCGFEIFFYTPDTLCFIDNKLAAFGSFINITGGGAIGEGKTFYRVLRNTTIEFDKISVVMIRQNPPFDKDYLTNTYLLEHLPKSCFVFNHPKAIRDFPEKLSVLNFPDFIPKTIISGDYKRLLEFYEMQEMQGLAILKPIYGFGGNDVVMIASIKAFKEIVPKYLEQFGHCILQEYFPSIKTQGDKRVLIAGGEVLGAINRRPPSQSIISNLIAGGNAYTATLSKREFEISSKVAKHLYKNGIFLAGIDLINESLIEINVTSPTGFKSFNKLTGKTIHKDIVDMLIERIA